VKSRCQQQVPELLFELAEGVPIEQVLLNIGRNFHQLINSEESIELHRVLISHGAKGGKLSQMFFDAGPQRLINDMEQLLSKANAAGQLKIAKPLNAADQFFSLVKGGCNFRLLIGCATPQTDSEIDSHVRDVVGLFIRAYRP
jgi:TetR/AcrR family transcriptional repressor of mexJK operon